MLSGKPLPFFDKKLLFKIGSLMGRPLQVDLATSNLKRPSIAWLLIEFDVAKPLVNCIWIGVDDFGHWQKVEYDY